MRNQESEIRVPYPTSPVPLPPGEREKSPLPRREGIKGRVTDRIQFLTGLKAHWYQVIARTGQRGRELLLADSGQYLKNQRIT